MCSKYAAYFKTLHCMRSTIQLLIENEWSWITDHFQAEILQKNSRAPLETILVWTQYNIMVSIQKYTFDELCKLS